MATSLFIVVCFSLIIALSEASCEVSTGCKNKCSGKHIDLSDIIKPGTTIDATAKDNNDYSFVFSLCGGVVCGSTTSNVTAAVCQWKPDRSRGFSLGGPSEVTWSTDSTASAFNVTYSGQTPGDGTTRQAVLEFIEGNVKKTTIVFNEEVDNGKIHTFYFTITFSKGGNIAGPIGWVLISLALIGVIVYFVAGSLFMYFARGARGVEIIPNFVFWKSFPFLIVEGCLFVISPCRRLAKRGSDYEKI